MKRVISALIAAAVLLTFGACSDNKKENKESDDQNDLIGSWMTVNDGVTYYYEFSDDNTLNVYMGSYQLKAEYESEQEDGYVTLEIPLPTEDFGYIGVLDPSRTGEFTVTDGDREDHDRTAELKYDDEDPVTLTEAEDVGLADVPVPEDFKADEMLIGSWIHNYSNEQGSQHISFGDDGLMQIVEVYETDGVRLNIIRNCSYTTGNGNITITSVVADTETVSSAYSVTSNSLDLGGSPYTREGAAVETPTESVTDAPTEPS